MGLPTILDDLLAVRSPITDIESWCFCEGAVPTIFAAIPPNECTPDLVLRKLLDRTLVFFQPEFPPLSASSPAEPSSSSVEPSQGTVPYFSLIASLIATAALRVRQFPTLLQYVTSKCVDYMSRMTRSTQTHDACAFISTMLGHVGKYWYPFYQDVIATVVQVMESSAFVDALYQNQTFSSFLSYVDARNHPGSLLRHRPPLNAERPKRSRALVSDSRDLWKNNEEVLVQRGRVFEELHRSVVPFFQKPASALQTPEFQSAVDLVLRIVTNMNEVWLAKWVIVRWSEGPWEAPNASANPNDSLPSSPSASQVGQSASSSPSGFESAAMQHSVTVGSSTPTTAVVRNRRHIAPDRAPDDRNARLHNGIEQRKQKLAQRFSTPYSTVVSSPQGTPEHPPVAPPPAAPCPSYEWLLEHFPTKSPVDHTLAAFVTSVFRARPHWYNLFMGLCAQYVEEQAFALMDEFSHEGDTHFWSALSDTCRISRAFAALYCRPIQGLRSERVLMNDQPNIDLFCPSMLDLDRLFRKATVTGAHLALLGIVYPLVQAAFPAVSFFRRLLSHVTAVQETLASSARDTEHECLLWMVLSNLNLPVSAVPVTVMSADGSSTPVTSSSATFLYFPPFLKGIFPGLPEARVRAPIVPLMTRLAMTPTRRAAQVAQTDIAEHTAAAFFTEHAMLGKFLACLSELLMESYERTFRETQAVRIAPKHMHDEPEKRHDIVKRQATQELVWRMKEHLKNFSTSSAVVDSAVNITLQRLLHGRFDVWFTYRIMPVLEFHIQALVKSKTPVSPSRPRHAANKRDEHAGLTEREFLQNEFTVLQQLVVVDNLWTARIEQRIVVLVQNLLTKSVVEDETWARLEQVLVFACSEQMQDFVSPYILLRRIRSGENAKNARSVALDRLKGMHLIEDIEWERMPFSQVS
jgi:hypothetical protein